jgi:uncharacterized coiled-coil protein SlyX
VATLEERVSFLEGRAMEHSRTIDGIREAVTSLEQRMDRRFEMVDQRFAALEEKIDRRFAAVDQRFGALDQKLTRHFLWLVGIMVAAMAAMIVRVVP